MNLKSFAITAAFSIVVSCQVAFAFSPSHSFRHRVSSAWSNNRPTSSELRVSWWDGDDDSRQAAMRHNIMRTDLRNFLTQRSLQSFMHLCLQCRDPHTVKWLEDFGGWKGLEGFHGTGALNITKFPTWSSSLMEMMEQPEDVVVVSAKRRGKGTGGWSKNNPYLEDRYVEFNIDIDPTSLATRILSVREQIAEEWVSDLETLKITNDMVLESYNEHVKQAREEESCEEDSYEDVECILSENKPPQIAFDRNAVVFLRNSASLSDRASSPFRGGSFDLLTLLATQESIHRVLRDYIDAGKDREVSFQWFRDFYVERVAKFFDGHQENGSADNFLEELLLTPPSIKTDESGKMGLVDPLRIAEDIIATRSKVAMEWKETASHTKDDHVGIRKVLLEKQMLKWGQPAPTPTIEEEVEVQTTVTSDEIYGEFQ